MVEKKTKVVFAACFNANYFRSILYINCFQILTIQHDIKGFDL